MNGTPLDLRPSDFSLDFLRCNIFGRRVMRNSPVFSLLPSCCNILGRRIMRFCILQIFGFQQNAESILIQIECVKTETSHFHTLFFYPICPSRTVCPHLCKADSPHLPRLLYRWGYMHIIRFLRNLSRRNRSKQLLTIWLNPYISYDAIRLHRRKRICPGGILRLITSF